MEVDSSDSSSSDDEFYEDVLEAPEPTRRVLRDRSDPMTFYDDVEFRSRFRLSKGAVLTVLCAIGQQLGHDSKRNVPVSPINQLLIGLRYYACSSFQVGICVMSDNRYDNPKFFCI